MAATGGLVSFTNLSYNVAETIAIVFSSGSLTAATSSNIVVSAGAASRLIVLTQPSATATAGVAFAQQPVIRVEDAFGNLRSSDNSTTVSASRGAGSGVLQGSTNVAAAGGIVTFTNLAHNVATNITIQFTSASLTGVVSLGMSVNPAAASRLTIQTQPSTTATAGAVFGQQPIIRVEDPFGNLESTDSSRLVTASLNAGTGVLQGTTNLTLANGLFSFPNLSYNLAEVISLNFESAGLTRATSSNVTISPGPFTQVQLLAPGESAAPGTSSGKTGTPLAQTAGIAFNVSARAVDAFCNLITNVADTVGITASDTNAIVPTNAPLAAGTRNFSLTLKASGTWTVTASDVTQPAKAAGSSTVPVNAGAFAELQLLAPGETSAPGSSSGKIGAPTAQTAGAAFSVIVNAVDTNWNRISTITDTVGINCSDTNAVLPANAALTAGTGAFSVTAKAAGGRTVTASDLSDGTKAASTSSSITINAGPFGKLQLLAPGETAVPGTAIGKTGSPSAQTAGTAFNVTVNAVDTNWNLVTSVADVVSVTASDSNAAMPGTAALVSGTKSFSVTLKTAGTATVSSSEITNPSIPGASTPSFAVNPAAFAKLQLLTPGESIAPGTGTGKIGAPGAQTAGTPFTITVNGVDANWNLVSTATDTVAISSSDANASLPSSAALVAGVRSFSVTLKTAGGPTLTATDSTNAAKTNSTSPSIAVNAGSLAKLQLLAPGETAAPGSSTGKAGTPPHKSLERLLV